MIDVFNLKIGDRLIYQVPKNVKTEFFVKKDGHIVEITNIENVFDAKTFDAVIKYVVVDRTDNTSYALSGKSYEYLEYAPEPLTPKPDIYDLERRIKLLEERLEHLKVVGSNSGGTVICEPVK